MEAVFVPVLLAQLGRTDLRPVVRNAGGGAKFWPLARRFNAAGQHQVVLGLADLEQAACAPVLLAQQLPGGKSPGFHVRLAVRMLESWLLADRQALAGFLRVPVAAVPTQPDAQAHPKRTLIELARQSKSRTIRAALLPGDSGALVGPDYVATMCTFIEQHWQAARARPASPSLERACRRWAAL